MPRNQNSFKKGSVCPLGVAESKHCPQKLSPEVRNCLFSWGSSPWMGQVDGAQRQAQSPTDSGFEPTQFNVARAQFGKLVIGLCEP